MEGLIDFTETVEYQNAIYIIQKMVIPKFETYQIRLKKRITFPDVLGFGHQVDFGFHYDRTGISYYKINHDEFQSSTGGEWLPFDDNFLEIYNTIKALIDNNSFSEEAKAVFEEAQWVEDVTRKGV